MYDMMMGLLGGLLIGVTLALTGGGGSMVAMPALTVGLHLSLAQAAPVSLMIVGLSAIAGWWEAARKGQLAWSAIARFALVAMPALILARRVATHLPDAGLSAGFGLLALWIAARPPESRPGGPPITTARFFVIAAVTGMMAGLFGAGGGFLITPALALGAGMDLRTAIPNALVVITAFGIFGILASAGQWSHTTWSAPVLLMLTVAVLTGWIGGRWRTRLAPGIIRTLFQLVVGAAGCIMLARALQNLL
ncbi:MAG: sulfite exporter TauE/SafE family protein [Chloroherpetonaceae bacterium]|nr:sulfite exporter TauE/SafE family protein [Chthonomonadaceae bacterium]MDW8206271.1 sulfite exporter TauE/SafE family protein [Chloroherpetonaceae bacterium]